MVFLGAGSVVALVILAFWLWALFDCIGTEGALCRKLPKALWVILVLVLPTIGALAWVLLGRPERAGRPPGSVDYSAPRPPIGFEDSPRYAEIAGLSHRRSEELDRRLDEWEAELTAREDELRRRDDELGEPGTEAAGD